MPVSLEASYRLNATRSILPLLVCQGASNLRILWRYILPNVLPPLVIVIIQHLGDAIILVASFSLIGIGVQPPDPEWGRYLVELPRFSTNGAVVANLPGARYFYYCCFI